jgi:predicted dehydrogenase
MRFANGVLFQFDSGFTSPLRAYMEIVGSEAVLSIPNPFKPGIRNEITIRRGEREQRLKVRGSELYLGEVEDMCEAILNGRPPRVTLEDSRNNVAAILALLESAGKSRPVLFAETTK